MSEDQIQEEQYADMDAQEQYEMLMKHLHGNFDPYAFLTPSQREIAMLTLEELETEFNLVQAKQSTRSRAQRDLIEDRYAYETAKADTQKDAE